MTKRRLNVCSKSIDSSQPAPTAQADLSRNFFLFVQFLYIKGTSCSIIQLGVKQNGVYILNKSENASLLLLVKMAEKRFYFNFFFFFFFFFLYMCSEQVKAKNEICMYDFIFFLKNKTRDILSQNICVAFSLSFSIDS